MGNTICFDQRYVIKEREKERERERKRERECREKGEERVEIYSKEIDR